jgi:hypothetical protein
MCEFMMAVHMTQPRVCRYYGDGLSCIAKYDANAPPQFSKMQLWDYRALQATKDALQFVRRDGKHWKSGVREASMLIGKRQRSCRRS